MPGPASVSNSATGGEHARLRHLHLTTSFLAHLKHQYKTHNPVAEMKDLRAKFAKVSPVRIYHDHVIHSRPSQRSNQYSSNATPRQSNRSHGRSERELPRKLSMVYDAIEVEQEDTATILDSVDTANATVVQNQEASMAVPSAPAARMTFKDAHAKDALNHQFSAGHFLVHQQRGLSSRRSFRNSSQGSIPSNDNDSEAPADDVLDQQQQDEVSYFSQRMGDLNFKLRRQHVLHPHGRPRAVWDCLLVALITWILVSVPFELSFSELRPNTRKAMLTFDLAIDILFVIDIVLNFMTAIESDGKLHFSFRNIVRHYVRGWFVFDVVWTVPMYIVLAVPPWTPWPGISSQLAVTKPWLYPLFRCVRALRVFSLFRIRRRLEYSLRISSKVSSLGSFLFVVFALAHVFSCTFAYLAFGDEEHLSYALDSRTLEEDTPQTKYIASLYWSMMTMTTVGYGDLTIRSNLGRLFSIGAMAVGGGVFAYGITNVVALFQQLYVEETEHQHKMDQVNTFMHHRSLPRKLCDEVRANFFHLKKAAHEKKMHDHQLFQQMSRTIQSKVASKFCEDMMPHRMPFLVGCSAEFIHELYLNMEVRCFLPGEDIIRQDEFGTELHFLFVGHVVVFLGQVRVAAFGPNTSFGEFGIFNPRKPRLATIQAMDFCETHCMDRRMLLAVLVRHPFMLYSIKQLATLRSKKGLTLLHENGGKGRTLLQGLAAVWHLEGSVGLLPPGMTMEDAPLLSELMGPPPTQLGGMRGASVRSSIGMFGQQPRRKSVVTAELDSSSQWAPSSHVISQSDNITQHTSRRRKSVAEGIDDLHLGPLNARMTVVSLQKKPSDVAMQMANSKDPTPPGTPSTAPHAPPSLVMPIQLQAADPAVELHEDKRVTALVADVQEVLRSQRALEMKLQAVMEMLAASHHNRVENVV